MTRAEAIAICAREMPVPARDAFIEGQCAGDQNLRRAVSALLAQDGVSAATQAPTAALSPVEVPSPVPTGEAIGQVLGRYKLLERIGEGGWGHVYAAEQMQPVRRMVALKVLKPGVDTGEVLARFTAERQALALMDHPNIARVLDAGATDRGRPFFVMELVRGLRVTDYCDQARLGTEARLNLFIQVCQAIQHAHQKGVIHRDIKPSNILVSVHDGLAVPKVIDFGIAKATAGRLSDATVHTQVSQFIGTPAYMSPEQAEMSGLDIDTRSDIYSLGVLLYELLTGHTPFDTGKLMESGLDELRRTIREQEPVRPSTRLTTLNGDELATMASRRSEDAPGLVQRIQGDLDWIVMKCLEKDRTRRYETASGLAADIRRHLTHQPVIARPPSLGYALQKAIRRNRALVAAGSLVAVVLVAGGAVSLWQAIVATRARAAERQLRVGAEALQRRAEAERSRAEANERREREHAYAADISLAHQSILANNLGRARRLLDRQRPEPGREDLRHWEWAYLWQLCQGDLAAALAHEGSGVRHLAFVGEEGPLLSLGEDNTLNRWNLNPPGRLAVVATNAPDSGFAYLPGHQLAAMSDGSVVRLLDLRTGTEHRLVPERSPGTKESTRRLALSANAEFVAILREGTRALELRQADSGRVVASADFPTRWELRHDNILQFSPDNRLVVVAGFDATVRAFEVPTLRLACQFLAQDPPASVMAMAISPDGRTVATGAGYEIQEIRLWDLATGNRLASLSGHEGWVSDLTFSPDGKWLASSHADQTIRLWDTRNWRQRRVLRGHGDEVWTLAFSPSGRWLASGGKDGSIFVWDTATETADRTYRRFPDSVSEAHPLQSEDGLLTRDKDGRLAVWAGPTTQRVRQLDDGTMVYPSGGSTVVASYDGTNWLNLIRPTPTGFVPMTRIEAGPGLGRRRPGFSLVPSASGAQLAWGPATSGEVRLAAADRPAVFRRLTMTEQGHRPRRFLAGDSLLWTEGQDGTDMLWEVASGSLVASYDAGRQVEEILATPERTIILRASQRIEIHTPGVAHHQELALGHYSLNGMSLAPDGKTLAIGSEDAVIRLFRLPEGRLINALHGHRFNVTGLRFSDDGRRLVSLNGESETVKIWDVATGRDLLTLAGAGARLQRTFYCQGGRTLVAGSHTGNWQMWFAPTLTEIDDAERNGRAWRRNFSSNGGP